MSLFLWNRRDLVNGHKTHTRVVNIVSKKFNLSITSFAVMMSCNPWHVMWQMEFDTWHATLDTLGWCTLSKNSRSPAVTVFWVIIFKASAFWAYAFYKSKCPYVCLSVCSILNIFVSKWFKIAKQKKVVSLAEFALQNMVETRLPDGLETSGRRVYC